MILNIIKNEIEQKVKKYYKINFIFKNNNKVNEGEFYLPLFMYSKILKKDITTLFNEIKGIISFLKEIQDVYLLNDFINIKLKRSIVSVQILKKIIILEDNYGSRDFQNRIVVLDYSSPNIMKNFSVGHLRSTVIGNSLNNIYKKLGFKTISINYLGDWGTQFGKIIYAYLNWTTKEKIMNSSNPIEEIQKL
ncbi:MAG: arginine--tRNA ligase, partial [Candidatus Phytoplasma australasiaticum]|nr:arginine--tRNA ligase [Candidatus Phytoplasma australasiaticum]